MKKLSKILLVFILLIGIMAITSLSCPYFVYAQEDQGVPEIPPQLAPPFLTGLGATSLFFIRRFFKK